MLKSSQCVRILTIYTIPILLVTWCFVYFVNPNPAYQEVLRHFKDQKKLFVADFLANEIDGDFDGSGIARLCAGRTWQPGLILSCESPVGGLGVVKNSHLNCFRFAIEMGAELVMPGIIRRNDDDIADLTPGNPKGTYKSKTMDYFWDYDHLNFTLATYCPQMRIHPSMNELWNVPSVLSSIGIGLKELRVPLVKTSVIKDMTLFKKRIAEYVQEKSPLRERRMPVRFHMAATYFAWPTEADSPVLRRNWGRILRSRRDARELAASALFGLQTRFRLRLDPRRGLGAAEEPSTHAKADTFVGVHLRTEVDAAKYPPYEEQAAYYLHHLQRSGAAVAFLATGASREHVATFRQRARDLNVTVVCKQDLLGGDELGMLERHLSYDQRALVDYEIMLRAGLVVGTSQSSFAWNLAMRRANLYEHVGNSNSTPAAGRSKVQWQDGYTTLFGQSEAGEALQRTIWP